MATVEQCRGAIVQLAKHLLDGEAEKNQRAFPDRSIAVVLPDIQTIFVGWLEAGQLVDIETGSDDQNVKITMNMSSNDLLMLVAGELAGELLETKAFTTRRLTINSSITDLLTMRQRLG